MQIVVRQISGLGNQLFQYAAGRYYADRYHADLRIAVDAAERAVSHGHPRPFLLHHFSISVPFAEMSRLDTLMLSGRVKLQPIVRLAGDLLSIDVIREPFLERYRFFPELPLRDSARTVYLAGYWQTYRTLAAIETQLRHELEFKQPPEGKNLATLQRIRQTLNAVSLHIRRGDYTLAAEGNIALPIHYYRRAIRMFRERFTDPTFFVFSDDLEFARNELPRDVPLVFIDHNDAASAHEDLRLMSSCRHHIIANSTFSWWAAWLNPRPDKVVFAPRYWHLTRNSFFPDLIPPAWILDDGAAL